MRRNKGFTLIELLVVIAIIGILAAMLFPVFARAREAARKTQCLANVKNIAIALNMYLTDFDRTPPANADKAAQHVFLSLYDDGCSYDGGADMATAANPYLRWPVVLDEYVKSREVWKCPSAQISGGATFVIPDPDYLRYLTVTHAATEWSDTAEVLVCDQTWPNGWGGEVTDSIAQVAYGVTPKVKDGPAVHGAFMQSIATIDKTGVSTSMVNDAASYVVCGDGGNRNSGILVGTLAWPNFCCGSCNIFVATDYGCDTGWDDTYTYDAACMSVHPNKDGTWFTNPQKRKQYTRHLGGSNVGYFDGHAKWMPAESIIAAYRGNTIGGLEMDFGKYDGCIDGYPGI